MPYIHSIIDDTNSRHYKNMKETLLFDSRRLDFSKGVKLHPVVAISSSPLVTSMAFLQAIENYLKTHPKHPIKKLFIYDDTHTDIQYWAVGWSEIIKVWFYQYSDTKTPYYGTIVQCPRIDLIDRHFLDILY